MNVDAELARSGLFGEVEERRFAHAHALTREGVLDRVASTSVVAALPPEERRALLERVRAHVGGESAVLRYVTEVYVADRLDFKVS